MKLELFNFIDETVKTFEENREEYKKISHIIYSFLKEALRHYHLSADIWKWLRHF